jgi:hypothetical protein
VQVGAAADVTVAAAGAGAVALLAAESMQREGLAALLSYAGDHAQPVPYLLLNQQLNVVKTCGVSQLPSLHVRAGTSVYKVIQGKKQLC